MEEGLDGGRERRCGGLELLRHVAGRVKVDCDVSGWKRCGTTASRKCPYVFLPGSESYSF